MSATYGLLSWPFPTGRVGISPGARSAGYSVRAPERSKWERSPPASANSRSLLLIAPPTTKARPIVIGAAITACEAVFIARTLPHPARRDKASRAHHDRVAPDAGGLPSIREADTALARRFNAVPAAGNSRGPDRPCSSSPNRSEHRSTE